MKAKISIILFLIILTIGAVSANENITDDSNLQIHTDESLKITDDGNFKNLAETINCADENSEINLTRDYTYNITTDEDSSEITINKSLTIDGKGHTIKSDNNMIYISGKNVLLKNIIFKQTRIDSSAENITIINCSFIDCNGGSGGAIYTTGENSTIINSTFKNCSARSGGAIHFSKDDYEIYLEDDYETVYFNGNYTYIKNCSFIDCHADEDGGAIHTRGENCTIVDSRFENCYAEIGGAISFSRNSKNIYRGDDYETVYLNGDYANIKNCSFKDCSGSIYSSGKNCTIIDASFINCDNAVYSSGENSTIINSSFINCDNAVKIYGNMFTDIKNGELVTGYEIVDSTIKNCSFKDCSGATRFEWARFTIVSCDFKDNHKDSNGAIYSYSCDCILSDCTFKNFTADQEGNLAVEFWNNYKWDRKKSNIAISNCSFEKCSSISNHLGGAMYLPNNDKITVSNCNFMKCTCDWQGGAIAGSKFTYRNCSFKDCMGQWGGAVVGGYGHDSTFINCSAEIGGAIWYGDAYRSSFINCHASDSGGAILGPYGDHSIVENCIFEKCTAKNEGGAIWGGDVTNCIFKKCKTSQSNTRDAVVYDAVCKNCIFDNPNIVAKNLKATYQAGSYCTITVYGENNKISANTPVTVKINGKTFKTLKTDKKGVAKFKVTQAPGSYKLTITALGATLTTTLKVNHLVSLKKATVKKSAKKLTLQASLGKVNGKYLKGKQITFKFNGKTYKAKTDKKGIAKVTVNSNVLKKLKVGKTISYQATYLKDTVTQKVKVQK